MYRDPSDQGRLALLRLVDDLPGMVAYWDSTLHCRFANRAYEKWFGVTAESMPGRDMKEFLGALFELNRPHIEAALRGEDQEFERAIPDPRGGPPRLSQTHYIPDVVDGVVRGFTVLVADITRRHHAEQALHQMERKVHASERLAAVATLAAGTAHELNNPLAAAHANIELGLEELQRGAGDRDALHATLTEARDAIWRARAILRNMATLARGETTTREPVELGAVIETSLQLTASAFRYKARLIREGGDACWVLANAAQLVQVVVNLLLNASQALAETTIDRNEIRVVTRRDGGNVVIEIHDNGCGIPVENHTRIFEPFFTTKDIGGGMGLGLSIALGIVQSLGGTLTVRSAPGAGSMFAVSLPETRAVAPVRAPALDGGILTASTARRRILIVDDEQLLTRTLRRALAPTYDVVVADSGPAALEVLSASGAAIDLVLCDLMMPVMTGQDVYEAVVALRPELRHRFVIMTGGAFTSAGHAFLSAFEGRLIKKPFEIAEVRAIIAATLVTV